MLFVGSWYYASNQNQIEDDYLHVKCLCFCRKSLFEEAGKYFDKETGVLEAPMIIKVADQVCLFFQWAGTHI